MKMPHELMSKNYCGPSKVVPLGQIRNEDGFKFIGIDKDGGEHYCIVRKEGKKFFMGSNTITFQELIGWVPDTETPNAKSQATDAALSRQVACTDGLGVAVPPQPTFGGTGK